MVGVETALGEDSFYYQSWAVFDKSEGMLSSSPPISAVSDPAVCSLFSESHFLSLFSLCCSVKPGKDVLFAPLIRRLLLVRERHAGLGG